MNPSDYIVEENGSSRVLSYKYKLAHSYYLRGNKCLKEFLESEDFLPVLLDWYCIVGGRLKPEEDELQGKDGERRRLEYMINLIKECHRHKGIVNSLMKVENRALEFYKQAVQADWSHSRSHYALGMLYLHGLFVKTEEKNLAAHHFHQAVMAEKTESSRCALIEMSYLELQGLTLVWSGSELGTLCQIHALPTYYYDKLSKLMLEYRDKPQAEFKATQEMLDCLEKIIKGDSYLTQQLLTSCTNQGDFHPLCGAIYEYLVAKPEIATDVKFRWAYSLVLLLGVGCEKNTKKAKELLIENAEAGHIASQRAISDLLHQDGMVEKDQGILKNAMKWMKKAWHSYQHIDGIPFPYYQILQDDHENYIEIREAMKSMSIHSCKGQKFFFWLKLIEQSEPYYTVNSGEFKSVPSPLPTSINHLTRAILQLHEEPKYLRHLLDLYNCFDPLLDQEEFEKILRHLYTPSFIKKLSFNLKVLFATINRFKALKKD